MLTHLLALTLGAGLLSGFPRDTGGRVTQPALGLVLDGTPLVVVAASDRLTAFRADGTTPGGLPFVLPGDERLVGAPAAAELGDRRPALAVVTASGKLYLWSGGGVAAGFPVSLSAPARAGPSFADVDGDGQLELLVGDEQGRVHAFKRSGARVKGFPIQGGRAAVSSSVSSSVFAGGPSLAWGAQDGKVWVTSTAGAVRPGFPLTTAFAVTGAPVFADLDDDGQMDLVVASQDFKVHAVDGKGRALPGFPVAAGYRIYEAPAVVDLDGDRRLDVVFASADGFLHAVDRTGRPLPGFPVRVGPRLFSGPVVGDVDRDGALEVVVAAADGTVVAVSRAGRILPGFPASLGEADLAASPLLFDLAGDGGAAILVGTPSGRLHGLRAEGAGAGAAPGALPWPAVAHDPARSGRSGPNPPSYRDLAITPEAPRLADGLQATWRATWLDAGPGAAIPPPRLTWLRNGGPVAGLEGKPRLPAGTARRGERWRFALAGAGDTRVESAEVLVLDTAPGSPVVKVEPQAPGRGTPVRATLAAPAIDPDGDPVRYRFDWLLDGLETGVTGETFPGERLRRGLTLTARVVASDGELESAPALAAVEVANSAPGPLAVALDPVRPRRTDRLRTVVTAPAVDPDGDPLTTRYRWSVDGVGLPLPLAAGELPPGLLRKHQRVRLEARAFDGQLEGPPAFAEAEVDNSPPAPPQVGIRPARPRHGEPLRAVLTAPAEDADGDPLTLSFAWTRNGTPLSGLADPREVPGALVRRGDRYEVVVQPSDGEAQGAGATAAAVVANTPPEPPRIAIEPGRPRGGEPLRLVVTEPARDADGDPVTLQIAWSRDGKPTGDGGETLAPQHFKKHERVRVVVTPSDGREPGLPVSAEVEVENAPPTAPEVVLAPARPDVGGPLRAVIQAPARDPDGDWVTYRFRWRRDGAPYQPPGGDRAQAPGWSSVNEVSADQLARGQRWEVEVEAFDGEAHGPAVRAAAEVVNSPPPPPEIAFWPARPRRVDGLSVQVRQPPDPDGDQVTHRFTWSRNGARHDAPAGQAQIPPGVPRKGERWSVEVVALDGMAESAPVRGEVVIADSPPGRAEVALCDGPVPSGTVPEARITRPAEDPDGDPVSYRYAWSLNGAVQPQATQARYGAALRKHDEVQVRVTPWDGELAGPAVAATCAGRNTPPSRPEAVLEPATPTALSGLGVKLLRPPTDADGDAVTLRYRWWRDGLPFPLAGPSLAPGALRHGETWRVEVVAFDGEQEGEPLRLEATVANTAPPRPQVTVQPPAPAAGAALTCQALAPERDADQEPITTVIRWLRNDRPEPLAEGQAILPAGVIRRGERWRCEAWTWDGHAESPRASAEVTVRNSPPGAPRVVIEPAVARTRDELGCRVASPSVDPDGDEVTYQFTWWRNDRQLPEAPGSGRLSQAATAKGDRFRCSVVPSDGTSKGPAGTAERVISNAPPGPVRIAIESTTLGSGRPIRCRVVTPSRDPDGDPVRYRYRWQRNGVPQPFAETSEEVPVRMLRAGDRWRCLVTPTDGDLDGPESGSDESQVADTP